MTYQEATDQLRATGYTRVEKDDRLLDILPAETREKGIELWELWQQQQVKLARLKVDHPDLTPEHATIPRPTLEQALQSNQALNLNTFKM